MKTRIVYLLCLLGVVGAIHASSKLNFGSKSSAINIENGSTFCVYPEGMTINHGTLNAKERGILTGFSIRFNRGIFASYNSQSDITGVFNPGQGGGLEIGENPDPEDADILIANPGGLNEISLLVKPGASFLRGQPLFFGSNDIVLQNNATLLAIAIQNTLNTNVTLNGGEIFLQDDLRLGDDAIFDGDGSIVLNNRRLSLGGTTSIWRGNLLWISSLDIQLNSQTIVRGVWRFFGDGQINGNSNVLDISNGGVIFIYPNSTLRLSGVKLKGLGSGRIFMGSGAQLRLSGTDIEMDESYIINSGGFYVDGDSTIITGNNTLTFESTLDSHGSLTVDRVALTDDHLDNVTQSNIYPYAIQDPNHKYITTINGGIIRQMRQESSSFLNYSADTAVQRYAIVTPRRPMKVFPEVNTQTMALNYNITIDGGTNFYGFTKSDSPIMFVSDNVKATYRNVVFRDFSPKHLSLGQNASLTFGEKTMITLARNEVLNDTWVFEGNTILRGGGQILEFGENGALVLQGANGSLLLDGITLKNVSGYKIRCLQDTSKIVFKDVKIYQDADFTYTTGGIELLGNLSMSGPYDFNYLSSQPFNILSNAMFEITRDKIFHYQPSSGARDLFQMADRTSTFRMENATLEAPAPGMEVTSGWIVVSDRNYVDNEGGSSAADGVVFGGSTVIQQQGSSSLELINGFFSENTD